MTALGLLALGLSAQAAELSWSGFATLGYAQSDADFTLQRHISDDGGWRRDSVLAGQLDAKLSPNWSATAQLRLGPALKDDRGWDVEARWAFVAWRPNNDWLLRAGRLRVPLYLHSETLDIGAAHDFVRLPAEMYWITPTNDFTGLYATRSWALGARDLSLDAYSGKASTALRRFLSQGAGPALPAGPFYTDVRLRSSGMVLTLRDANSLLRSGLHYTATQRRDGSALPSSYPFVTLSPGLGYYQVDASLPGPGIPGTQSVRNLVYTLGAEQQFGAGWRLSGELARVHQLDTQIGADANSGYIALSRSIGALTPYATLGRMLSNRSQRDWQQRLATTALPSFIPGAAAVNGAQQLAAETVPVYDQRSVALGLSYALNASSKIKGEWLRTWIGAPSATATPAVGQPWPRDTHADVLSVNYSIAF